MKMRDIGFVAVYEAKQLSRQWEFFLFVFFSLIGITLCHVFLQGRGHEQGWCLVALPCSMPWLNAYLYSVIQSLFLIIMMSDVPKREARGGALESIHARPLSNGDYTVGRVCGVFILFVLVNVAVMLSCMLFVHVGSASPFKLEYYFFYFLTLCVPSFAFVAGLSLCLGRLLRSRYLVIFLLVLLLVISVSWLPFHFHGTFDFLGNGVPGLFSDMTGLAAPWNYYLHRVIYFLLGLGLIACSVRSMKRIPNEKRGVKVYSYMGYLLILGGISCMLFIETDYWLTRKARVAYRESFVRHERQTSCRVTRHDIRLEQIDDRLRVTSELTLYNPNTRTIDRPLLFLNPGLKIFSLEMRGRMLPYQRDGQVVIIESPLNAGDSLCLKLQYEGSIDERFTSLHVRDDVFESSFRASNRFLPVGRRSAFVDDYFLLLTPACAWYPMAVPPVNPEAPVFSRKDLTRFSLRIVRPRQKMLLSQGMSSRRGDTTLFRPTCPLAGISLCGGDFQLQKLETGDLRLSLYTFKGHGALLRKFSTFSKKTIRDFFVRFFYPALDYPLSKYNWYEDKTRNLYLLETPLPFYVETVPGWTVSGQVEPGMVFLPERVFDTGNSVLLETAVTKDVNREIFNTDPVMVREFSEEDICLGLMGFVSGEHLYDGLSYSLNRWLGSSVTRANPYNGMSLFQEPGVQIYSEEYPFVGHIMEQLLTKYRGHDILEYGPNITNHRVREALDYMNGRDLESIYRDKKLDESLLFELNRIKKKDLIERLSLGIPLDTFLYALKEVYLSSSGVITWKEFTGKLDQRLVIDTKRIFAEWYHARHEQFYKVKDWHIGWCCKQDGTIYSQIEGMVMNCGKEGGIVTAIMMTHEGTKYYRCFLQSGEAKSFCMKYEGILIPTVYFDTGLSANRPQNYEAYSKEIFISESELAEMDATWTSVDSSAFTASPNVTIVDNCDPGFSYSDGELTWLQKWFDKEPEVQYSAWPCVRTNRWTPSVGPYYGDSVRSCYYKSFGSGKSTATWKTFLSKAGKYKIMANVSRVVLTIGASNYPPGGVSYHYRVKQGDCTTDVEVSLDEQLGVGPGTGSGWVTLGEFDFLAGEVSVTLSDRDERQRSDIAIMADAVKWIKLD